MTRSVFLVLGLLIFNGFDVCSSQSTVTIQFKTSKVTMDEGTIYDIQLVAQGTFDQNFTVNLMFTDGTAKYLSKYFYDPSITPSVTFTPGSISSSVFRVIAISNNKWEGATTFQVRFELHTDQDLNFNLESGTPDTLRIVIRDDETINISFQNSTQTVREDSTSVQLQLQSSGLNGRRFSVSFNCIQVLATEATDGDDFMGGLYTVQFWEQSTVSTTAEIPILNDFIPESSEYFTCVILRLKEDGIVLDCPRTIDIEIEDDDVRAVSFEKAVYSGEEGGILSDIRLKTTPFEIPFNVQIFATTLDASRPEKDYEATSGVDYIDPRCLSGGGVVRFHPEIGLLSTTLTICILPDNITEGIEYFGLSFVAINNGDELDVTPVEPTKAVVAINDTNVIVPIIVSFVKSKVTGGEGDVVKLRVNRTGSITENLECKVRTESTTAKKGVDFRVMTKSIVFNKLNADSEVKTVRVKLLSGNTNCFCVVLECKLSILIGCAPSATVCIQGN